MRIFLLSLTLSLIACFNQTYKTGDFTENILKWYKPFEQNQVAIYVSENNESDTILFQSPVSASDSTRNFEQGYSNTDYLTVHYEFSKGSFHQPAIMGDGKTPYDQDFVNAYKSSAGYGNLEISFIGTFFSDSLSNIQKLNDSTYFFNSDRADYKGMNVKKGINNFTFNTRLGVIAFTDDRNVKWIRK